MTYRPKKISLPWNLIIEENSGDEGLVEEAKNDKGKLTKATLKARSKEIKGDTTAMDEQAVLKQCLSLMDKEAAANKKIKTAQDDLDNKVFKKYPKLDETEIKTLVVDDKWQAKIKAAKSSIEKFKVMLDILSEEDYQKFGHAFMAMIRDTSATMEEAIHYIEQNIGEIQVSVIGHNQFPYKAGAVINAKLEGVNHAG